MTIETSLPHPTTDTNRKALQQIIVLPYLL
jgi:hypothetical protein